MKSKLNEKTVGKFGFASLGPGIFAALMAKASCPLCYPAIGAFLTSVGLGFLYEGSNFVILMGIFFSIALFGLAYKAKSRRGFLPFFLGLIGSLISITGRLLNSEISFYLGISALITASIWNIWPVKKEDCNNCEPAKEGETNV